MPPVTEVETKPRSHTGLLIVVVAILFGAAGLAIGHWWPKKNQPTTSNSQTVSEQAILASAETRPDGCVTAQIPRRSVSNKDQVFNIFTVYCVPKQWAAGKPHTVDVMTHGATYNHLYWNWPQGDYSFTKKTLAAGRAVLYYDRVGAGNSTRPNSKDVTFANDVEVLHHFITLMRQMGYANVNSLGHSFGSTIAVQEAGQYNDASKLVVTGYLHGSLQRATTHPADTDSAFTDQGIDDGYITTVAGTRDKAFMSPSADPRVAAYDELYKDVVSKTTFSGLLQQMPTPPAKNISSHITIPVYSLAGQDDATFCPAGGILNCHDEAAVTKHETPYYASAKSFKLTMVTNTGHDLNLQKTKNDTFDKINAWLEQ